MIQRAETAAAGLIAGTERTGNGIVTETETVAETEIEGVRGALATGRDSRAMNLAISNLPGRLCQIILHLIATAVAAAAAHSTTSKESN